MKNKVLTIAIVGCSIILSTSAFAETVLGQLAMTEARIDGVPSPTGTTVVSPSKVHTGDKPSVVHLSNGGQVLIGSDSGAMLAAGRPGAVKIAVIAGLVQLEDAQGEVTTLAQNSTAVVDEAGEVEIDPDLKVCVLESPGENSVEDCAADHGLEGCEWDPTKAGDLAEGDVYFVPSDEDGDCRRGFAAWIWGGGAVVGGLILSDSQDSDDNTPDASPSVP